MGLDMHGAMLDNAIHCSRLQLHLLNGRRHLYLGGEEVALVTRCGTTRFTVPPPPRSSGAPWSSAAARRADSVACCGLKTSADADITTFSTRHAELTCSPQR